MKILFLTHRFPWPPNRGDKIRSFHILEHLSKTHETVLLSFSESKEDEIGGVAHLKETCRETVTVHLDYSTARRRGARSFLSGEPVSVRAFRDRGYESAYIQLRDRYKPDLIFADSSALADYPLRHGDPFVVDFMDVDSEKWRQYAKKSKWPLSWIYRHEARQLARYEKKCAEKAKTVLVVSETEKSRLLTKNPDADVRAIPNGVSKAYFHPIDVETIPGRIVFTGVMDYFPNVDAVCWFARKVWPAVCRAHPEATFQIVGAQPSKKVQALTSIPGVEVTGPVDDVRPFLKQAQICVAPIRFSIGLQNKILEAMAMRKAVVSTPGAAEGLIGKGDGAIQIATDKKSFSQNVIELLENKEHRQELEESAFQYVSQYYDWDKNLQALNPLFER